MKMAWNASFHLLVKLYICLVIPSKPSLEKNSLNGQNHYMFQPCLVVFSRWKRIVNHGEALGVHIKASADHVKVAFDQRRHHTCPEINISKDPNVLQDAA
jgi:hypothetical protein